MRRNFTSNAPSNLTNQVLQTAGEAVSEFAFNKLNAFISQSNIKNFDLSLRSFNDASATLSLLHSRLVLTGSLFTNTGTSDLFNTNNTSLFNSSFNNLTKDFEAQYLLRSDGALTARYSYRVLNSTTLNTIGDQLGVQYVNGLGLVYQNDFDTFGEFFRNIFRNNHRRSALAPAPIPTSAPSKSPSTTTDTPPLTEKPDTGSKSSPQKSGGGGDDQ